MRAASAIQRRTVASLPAAIAALSWTRTRVASSSSFGLGVTERANLADDLAPRIAERAMQELPEPRRQIVRQRAEALQQRDDRRELRALRTVLDLDRDADPLVDDRDAMHALRADLGDAPALR